MIPAAFFWVQHGSFILTCTTLYKCLYTTVCGKVVARPDHFRAARVFSKPRVLIILIDNLLYMSSSGEKSLKSFGGWHNLVSLGIMSLEG